MVVLVVMALFGLFLKGGGGLVGLCCGGCCEGLVVLG